MAKKPISRRPAFKAAAKIAAAISSASILSACLIYFPTNPITSKRALVELRVNKASGAAVDQYLLFQIDESKDVYYDLELIGDFAVGADGCGAHILSRGERLDPDGEGYVYNQDSAGIAHTIYRQCDAVRDERLADETASLTWDFSARRLEVFDPDAETYTAWNLENPTAAAEVAALGSVTGADRTPTGLVKLDDGWIALASDPDLKMVFADLTSDFQIRRTFYAPGWSTVWQPKAWNTAAVKYQDGSVLAVQFVSDYYGSAIDAAFAGVRQSLATKIEITLDDWNPRGRVYIVGDRIVLFTESGAYTVNAPSGTFSQTTALSLAEFDRDAMRLDLGADGAIIASWPTARDSDGGDLSIRALVYDAVNNGIVSRVKVTPAMPAGWDASLTVALVMACRETASEYVFLLELVRYSDNQPWRFG